MVAITHALYIMSAYLLGAVPAVYFLARRQGIDLKKVGSRNVGVTNLLDHARPAVGIAGVAFDFLKGLLPPLLALFFGFGTTTMAIAGVAAVVGQMWPVFLRFQGGRGNLTACAAMVVIAPLALALGMVPIVLGAVCAALQRKASWGRPDVFGGALGVFLGALSVGIAVWFMAYPSAVQWSVCGLMVLLLVRRVTADLQADLQAPRQERWAILGARLLLDRAGP